jgi:rod shape-determining protein MreD
MIEKLARQFLRFVILLFVQVLVLDNIRLGGYINPYLYVLFILLLPVETPVLLLMSISFIMGLTVDMFNNTLGLHAAACVLLAFVRPYLLKLMAPRDGYEGERPLSLQVMGFGWFLTYSALMVFIHHTLIFYLEVFRLSEFFSTFFRMLLSMLLTLALILLTEFFFFKTKTEK